MQKEEEVLLTATTQLCIAASLHTPAEVVTSNKVSIVFLTATTRKRPLAKRETFRRRLPVNTNFILQPFA